MSSAIYEMLNFITLLKDSSDKGYAEHKIVKTNKKIELPTYNTRQEALRPLKDSDIADEVIEISHKEVKVAKGKDFEIINYPYIQISDANLKKRQEALKNLENEVFACQKCQLHTGRKNIVFGEGVANPIVMVIGEAPGVEEDLSGKPFVGKAGKYLEKWLTSIGLDRQVNIYVSNVIKCRPPQNRTPLQHEIDKCANFIDRQVEILKPLIIFSLGNPALQYLSRDRQAGITKKRGTQFFYKKSDLFASKYKNNIIVFPTYHPSGVLRDLDAGSDIKKKEVWEDLKTLQKMLQSKCDEQKFDDEINF